MREIKFRVLDKITRSIKIVSSINFEEKLLTVKGNSFAKPFNEFILLQYIGLNDNTKWEDLTENERGEWTTKGNLPSQWKGREIYEGDIVINTNCKYNKDYEGNVIKDIFQGQWLNSVQRKTRKIIGNIYTRMRSY